ncbi:hypothetical protein ZIOFF_074204 [Zingiber officinale]|uniref:Arabinogalactan peptide 16 n=1 Tax=Zingiber officinale TaxID=94328 RepID=A0A8J5EU19_ZINOF|nr:hypothetical protein ZIOFF_074204 [Zingiber officinale]
MFVGRSPRGLTPADKTGPPGWCLTRRAHPEAVFPSPGWRRDRYHQRRTGFVALPNRYKSRNALYRRHITGSKRKQEQLPEGGGGGQSDHIATLQTSLPLLLVLPAEKEEAAREIAGCVACFPTRGGRSRRQMAGIPRASLGLAAIMVLALAIFAPSVRANAPAPAPTSDGTSIDQGIAYLLMLVALVLTYLIHPLDASSPYKLF